MGAMRRPTQDDERNELERLRKKCDALREKLILRDGNHCRCGACGSEWPASKPELHDEGCVAAPERSARARASSSTQSSRGAASKRSR